MADWFDIFFKSGAKPIRRDAQVKITVDADGEEVLEPVSGESFTLSPEGSIDRISFVPDRFYHCGCNAELPMGGRCAEHSCGRVSCSRCFGRCAGCQKPICLEHSRFQELPEGGRARLCLGCQEALSRRQTLRSFVRGMLSPFVVFED